MVKLRIEILVHLAPEHLTGTCIVGIVEAILIARTHPVADIVGRRLDIHPTFGIEFLVVVCIAIELRPYGDHEATMHLVDIVEHLLGIRIA